MSFNKKILVVGAGLAGATVARELAENGFSVDVIDKRPHIAGNTFDYVNRYGIRVHKYGPHIFHTNNTKVYNWIKKYSEWIDYRHKVKAILDNGTFVVLPPNLETKKILGEENILDVLFRPYTRKMWGCELEDLNPKIINRIPIRNDKNEYYFPDDKYQLIPKQGYTTFIKNILDHPLINITLRKEFKKNMEKNFYKVFNSMPIDEYYNKKFGELPYRSIKFHNFHLPINSLLPVPTVNFTNNSKFTRVTEWKKYPNHGKNNEYTSLTFEEPCDYKDNNYERYYPVKDLKGHNTKLYKRYKSIKNEKVEFIGRCGQYVYIDMHQAISSSLATTRKFLKANLK